MYIGRSEDQVNIVRSCKGLFISTLIAEVMFKCALITTLATTAVAFCPSRNVRLSSIKSLSMGLVGSGSAEGLAGQTAPLGYFDPLGLSTGKTDGDIKVRLCESY